jgi:hypothetical protein
VSTPWLKFFFWAYLLFLTVVAAMAANPADPDLWHRLAVGEYLLRSGHFPAGNTFSYLADYQVIADHEWGSAVIFYSLWRAGGGTAMVVAKILTLLVTLALVVRAGLGSRRPTILVTGFYAVVLLALLPSFQSTLRCMVFTHIFLALWVWLWQRERRGRPVRDWVYPLTVVPWANLHGGFAIGLLWLGAVGVMEGALGGRWQPWARRLALSFAATIVNPYGWNLWTSTARALVAHRQGFGEWAAVVWIGEPISSYAGYKVLLPGAIVTLAYAIYRRGWRGVDRSGVLLVGLFMLLALDSARHTSLFAIVAGAVLPGFLREHSSFSSMRRPLRRMTYLVSSSTLAAFPFFAAIVLALPSATLTLSYPSVACPVGGVEFLRQQGVRGNLLVPFNYGSYALWQLRGQMRVSMDGRYDLVYTRATYDRVADFFDARRDWHGLLTSPAPNAILMPRSDPVYTQLRTEPGWTEAWHDEADAVFLPK